MNQALAVEARSTHFNANLNVNNSIFNGNTSTWTGGAIGIEFKQDALPEEATVTNSLIENGSAIEGNVTVTSLGDANVSDLVTIKNDIFLNNFAAANAGGLDTDSININVSDSQFIGNVSGGSSGALNSDFFFGSLYGSPQTKETVTNCSFVDNTSEGIAANIAAYFATFSSPAFGGSFTAGGGAVGSLWGANLTITDSTFTGNRSLNGVGGAILTGGAYLYEGTLDFATGASTTLSNDIFIGNYASKNGGVIADISSFGDNYPLGVPSVSISDSTLIGNSAAQDGGAIYTDGTVNTISDNAFIGNSAASGYDIYGTASTINGEASSTPGLAALLESSNIFIPLLSNDIVLS